MEAASFAKEIAGYVEKKYNTGKVHVWIDTSGQINALRWSIDMPDLAAVEKAQLASLMDPDYHKLVDRAFKAELFIDGQTHDVIMREIP